MSESRMKALKRSEVLKIEAAIVEVMENADFSVNEIVDVCESENEGHFRMSFPKDRTSLEGLNKIQKELGQNFRITICAKDKTRIVVCIEAHEDDFIKMLDKKPTSQQNNPQGGKSLFNGQGHR